MPKTKESLQSYPGNFIESVVGEFSALALAIKDTLTIKKPYSSQTAPLNPTAESEIRKILTGFN